LSVITYSYCTDWVGAALTVTIAYRAATYSRIPTREIHFLRA